LITSLPAIEALFSYRNATVVPLGRLQPCQNVAIGSFGGSNATHAVSVKITPSLRIECTFWLADDGWNSASDLIPISIHASSFEEAKSDMELALGKHIEKLLHEGSERKSEQAA
jgi:hypothetical protein